MKPQDVLKMITDFFAKNFSSGDTKVPPHQHNGVDNLKLPPSSIQGTAVTGNVVTSIVAGTNVTISPTTGVGAVTINSSGGGGGSPGGANTNVQFNESGSFGGDDEFDWDTSGKILTLDKGTGQGDGVVVTGGISNLTVRTAAQASGIVQCGDMSLIAGGYTGDDGGISGALNIQIEDSAANDFTNTLTIQGSSCGDLGNPGQNDGGAVNINAGNTGIGIAGTITLSTGNATSTGTAGACVVKLGGAGSNANRKYFQVKQFDSNGTVQPNVMFGNSVSFGAGQGVIGIKNRTTAPSSNPSAGGILYVENGALMYLGSSGTLTTIAPA